MPIFTSILCSILTSPTASLEFDGPKLPDQLGWTRHLYGSPLIDVSDGILIQSFDSPSDQDIYRQSIADYAGNSTFVAEWRMRTDAPSVLLDTLQIPAAFVLSGNTGVTYHFRFTDTVALFTRSDLSLGFFSIEPEVFHTYRIELLGDDTYRFLIDGALVESDIQPGRYPTPASEILWGGQFEQPGHTTQWDYIRYGTIPEPATASILILGSLLLTLRRKPKSGFPIA